MHTKTKILGNVKSARVGAFLGIYGVSILMPYFIHLQWVTGPLVNALLIICLFLVGVKSALVLCLVPSVVALSSGLILPVLAPMIPFIMIANCILVITMDYFYNKSSRQSTYWQGLMIGAGLKFFFLFASVNIISNLLIKQELAVKVAQMLSWPQLFTALTGGMIAFIFLKTIKRI